MSSMNELTSDWIPNRKRSLPHKDRVVDKKGVAVALAFLVGLTVLASGGGDKANETERWQEPALSVPVEIRPADHASLEVESAVPVRSMRQDQEDRGEAGRRTDFASI